jgi:GTPase
MLCNNYLDMMFLCSSAFQGITESTKSYLIFANMFNITPISIITQIDKVNDSELDIFLNNYKQFIKIFSKRKIPLIMKNEEEVSIFSRNLNENILPIFLISSKNGYGIDLLFTLLKYINFLDNKYINNLLLSQKILNFKSFAQNHSQFDIHDVFVFDKRVIIGGVVNKGNFSIGNEYYLGPDKKGEFK